jgi:plastocyanin
MRSIRLLAGLAILTAAGCTTAAPGWTYAPASASPAPSVDASASVAPSVSVAPSPSAAASPGASGAPSPSAPPGASAPTAVVEVSASNIAFQPTELSVAADQPFQIVFDNNDASIPHNVEIKDAAGASLFRGEVFNGVDSRTYDAPPLPAGTYQFVCTVHPNMVGTLTSQ